MKKLSLLSLFIVTNAFPMLGPVMRSAIRPHAVAGNSLLNVQNHEQSMQRRTVTGREPGDRYTPESSKENKTELATFLGRLNEQINKMDPELLAQLRYQKSTSSDEEWQRERFRMAAAVLLFGKDHGDLVEAIGYKDPELVAHLLLCGADSNVRGHDYTSAAKIAAGNNDCKTLELLLAAGADVTSALKDAYHIPFDALKLLLAYGADAKSLKRTVYLNESEAFEVPWSPIGNLDGISILKREWYGIDDWVLDDTQKVDLLKKVIVLTRAGDPLSFRVRNPMGSKESLVKYGRWHDEIDCCDAEGDWTTTGRFEKGFTDLANYTQAVMQFRKAESPEQKIEAEQAMSAIMRKWHISEEDVSVVPKAETVSSRVQE